MRSADERGNTVGKAFVPVNLFIELLTHEPELAEGFVATATKDRLVTILRSTRRTDYPL